MKTTGSFVASRRFAGKRVFRLFPVVFVLFAFAAALPAGRGGSGRMEEETDRKEKKEEYEKGLAACETGNCEEGAKSIRGAAKRDRIPARHFPAASESAREKIMGDDEKV